MAVQLAALLTPAVKELGKEVATEVAQKIVKEEIDAQKQKLRDIASRKKTEQAPKVSSSEKVRRFGARVASDALDSNALKTGMGAVLGTVAVAASATVRKAGEEDLFKKARESQEKKVAEQTAKQKEQQARAQQEETTGYKRRR